MEVLTKKEVIENVPKRWKAQYPDGREGIYEKLMGARPLTKEKIDSIIGNTSWTVLNCEQCGKDVNAVIVFEASEHGTMICKNCLTKALRKMEKC